MKNFWWIYHSITVTRVLTEGYYPWYEVLNQSQQNRSPSSPPQESVLADSQAGTCHFVHAAQLHTLQAIFDFPTYNIIDNISVDVLTKEAVDCSSPSWTWFVGSNCSSNMFRECKNIRIDNNGINSHCRVTCVCPDVGYCRTLHFKYILDQRAASMTSAICEVHLAYEDLSLPYIGSE